MTEDFPDRPEHIPRGYEWLPDAYKRGIEPHGPEALERVRFALGEGEIEAVLLLDLGHLEPIAGRMWRKTPVAKKVLPRFEDGRMRMGLDPYKGPKVESWILVPEGSLAKCLSGPEPGPKRSGPILRSDIQRWYRDRIREIEASGSIPSRDDDWEAAREQFEKPISRDEIPRLRNELAPSHWKKGGRRRAKPGEK
jgi:hypothetical protein